MTIAEFQDLIKRTYHVRDKKRGLDKNFLWFTEEVGELAEAVRKRDRREILLEAADVLAWLSTICSLSGVDLEKAALTKYGKGCPRCTGIPCSCR
ncbi:MAG TPA: MazG nucleotide pyrophosphohydrolase domain-containing protein [Planctomycetota bacterium]|jgi:NTP pyrophosphatase (non-canonical NTP hydrolase)|nr:MazG nucleotide pyrophosphohydrolase domain-containing protein [Planctomycetota bacterium]